jgi:hypothetical protein
MHSGPDGQGFVRISGQRQIDRDLKLRDQRDGSWTTDQTARPRAAPAEAAEGHANRMPTTCLYNAASSKSKS